MENAAKKIANNYNCSVLIKGGHNINDANDFLFKDGKGYVQAGAGIVNDSVPEKEFMETKNKALAVVNAVKEAARL